ncbi:bacteriohemerythrin [Nodosilinea nodulosa]|uniref:bacteriohemerythrin n=1 Tax=Nodosilinea nodulosa TaxID=416001 RepID=UPI0004746DE9|nr:bacteriohemerythrin [Nodosilinea nodulosa]
MTVAVWRDEYRTGHDTIDQQHRDLFAQVNHIYALTQTEPQDNLGIRAQLADFAAMAIAHFDLEEALMTQYDYPNFEVHFKTHRALVNKVQALLEKPDRGLDGLPAEVTQVLADWMVHHIRGEDQQMIRFLREQSIAAVGG